MVADSTDRERLPLLREEVARMLAHEDLRQATVLVYANKQDAKGALPAAEISQRLGLNAVKDRSWFIQACCALTGDGLAPGMDWLAQQVTAAKR